MNSQPKHSSSRKETKVIKIEPRIRGGGTMVITDKGTQTTDQYLEDIHQKKLTKEAKQIRETQLNEMNRDRRKDMKRSGSIRGFRNKSNFDKKAFYDDSGYVRHLTEEDLMTEELLKIRDQNWKAYGEKIDLNLGDIVRDYLENKDKITNTAEKTHLKECILLALTKAPTNPEELIKRLDVAMKYNDLKFRFMDIKGAITTKFNEIIGGERNWLHKYIVAHENGEHAGKFEFPPLLMKLAAESPDCLRRAWFTRLKPGEKHYTESDLLRDFPSLPKMLDFTVSTKGVLESPKRSEGKQLDSDLQVRVDRYGDARKERLEEIKHYWRETDDVLKGQLVIGVLQASNEYFRLARDLVDDTKRFMEENPNPNANFRDVTSGAVSTITTHMEDKTLAISKLVHTVPVSKRVKRYALIPEAASIKWADLRYMCSPRYSQKGWMLLKENCRKNEDLDRIINPKNYKQIEEPITEPIEEISSEPIEEISSEPFEVTGGDEAPRDPIDELFVAVNEVLTTEQIGQLALKAGPSLVRIAKAYLKKKLDL